MSYPPSSPGYPPAPQPSSPYGAPQPTRPIAPAAPAAPAGENPLSTYLLAGVAALGVLSYLLSYALETKAIVGLSVPLALTAGLLAGVGVLPKHKNVTGVAAVLSAVAFLLVLSAVVSGDSEWAIYVILGLTLVQTGVAIWALLLESGVIAPPAPRPQFEPQPPQYGQYGGPSQYYGQQSQPQHGGQPYQQAPPQRPGYPSQYGSYPSGPNTGGFLSQNPQGGPQRGGPQDGPQGGSQGGPQGGHNGPPTPPTGFPAFGQPQQQSSSSSSSNASAPTTQVPTQQPTQHSSSQQSGSSQS
jgi:hypothetical protein